MKYLSRLLAALLIIGAFLVPMTGCSEAVRITPEELLTNVQDAAENVGHLCPGH